MTRKEMKQIAGQMLDVYSGILFHNQEFDRGSAEDIVYEFDCPEFAELREKYNLEKITGKGSDFARAKRLLHYFSQRLTHATWYDNHVECNALRLLEYSLNNPERGINCVCKAKILVECCLALGIYARRVFTMPFSPYDFDNHVVAEIYDREREKWIMLDPTSDGYFIDEEKTPLSLLEMRSKFANAQFVTYVQSVASLKDLPKLREKRTDANAYICKNLFWFQVEKFSAFGENGEYLYFVPKNYSIKATREANLKYCLQNLPSQHEALRGDYEDRLHRLQSFQEPLRTGVQAMERKPS